MAIIHGTKENFDSEVLQSKVPVLVDFFAQWCGPCQMLAPILDKVAAELEGSGKAKIVKIDVDTQPDLAAQFGIRSIPTLKIFAGGEVTRTVVGGRSEEEIWELLGGR